MAPKRQNDRWPQAVRDFLGTWTDLPEINEIRARQGVDVPREKL